MYIDVYAQSVTGQVRLVNEDIALIQDETVTETPLSRRFDLDRDAPVIIAIADGMGGNQGGALAGHFAITEVKEWIKEVRPDTTYSQFIDEFDSLIEQIILKMTALSKKSAALSAMGTTLAGIIFNYRFVAAFNIGDSRIYRLHNNWLRQITVDHSLQQLRGNLQSAHFIYNAISANEKAFVDYFDLTHKVMADNIFLICSDGLSNRLTDDEMQQILTTDDPVTSLIEKANQRGGPDNITAVLIQIKRE